MSKCNHSTFYITHCVIVEGDEKESMSVGSGLITCEDCGKTVFDIKQENSALRTKLATAEKELNRNFRAELQAKAKLQETIKERDEAQAQVAVMRKALEKIPKVISKIRGGLGAGGKSTGMYIEVELGNVILDAISDELDEILDQALQSTPEAGGQICNNCAFDKCLDASAKNFKGCKNWRSRGEG